MFSKTQQYSLKTQRLFPENSRKFDQNSIFRNIGKILLEVKAAKKTSLPLVNLHVGVTAHQPEEVYPHVAETLLDFVRGGGWGGFVLEEMGARLRKP